MSKPDWCAQEAKRVYHSLENSHVFNEIAIARALMEAHQRGRREGMEEAAKVADEAKLVDSSLWATGSETNAYHDGQEYSSRTIAAAIRQLGEKA